MKNVVDTVIQTGNFKTLIQALQETDLIDTLSVDGPFTIFAPTDEAFNKVPKEILNDLLKNKEKLTELVTYHVLLEKVTAKSLIKLSTAPTVNREKLSIDTSNGIRINDARVIKTDIECSNGVIHVIDTVLIPN